MPPANDADLWVRYLLGHRRVLRSHLTDVAAHAHMGFGIEYPLWVEQLLDAPVAMVPGLQYESAKTGLCTQGPGRVSLTEHGARVVELWIHGGAFWQPIAGHYGGSRLILLALWAAGTGIPTGDAMRWPRRRREVLSAMLPGGERVARWFARPSVDAVANDELLDLLNRVATRPEASYFELGTRHYTDKHLGQHLRWLHADRQSLITRKPGLVQGPTPAFGAVGVQGWNLIRRTLRANNMLASCLPSRSLGFGRSLADRRITRVAKPPLAPTTKNGRNELFALQSIQQAVASMYRAHPGAVAMSASLWSITGFSVYRSGHVRAGHPSALDVRAGAGDIHPQLRSTQRYPDGVLWVPGDDEAEPSIWIEYEGNRSHLRSEEHIEAALAMSSRWAKHVDIIIVATADAIGEVVRDCRRFTEAENLERHRADWPGARVRVRVVRAADSDACLLHGDARWEIDLHAVGQPLGAVA